MVKEEEQEQEISTISRNLKALAKELNVPVIALSQLSRAVETRGSSKDLCFLTFVNQVR
jgi:replicative DNA helicase